MPHNDFIGKVLNLKDLNIFFSNNFYEERIIKGVINKIFKGTLSYQPKACYKCGHIMDNKIIKHGFKVSNITIPNISGFNSILKLKKQRYICKHCHKTFTLKTTIVNKNCYISNNTLRSIALDSKNKTSEKDIAFRNNVSHSTVNRVIDSAYETYKIKKNYLPKHLCFDEFKSVKAASGAMSFMFCDADTREIVDIVENRRLQYLLTYFLSFSKEARKSVETVVIDMYKPYMTLIKTVFPNAKIVIDKFHLVQLYNRSLNKTRVLVMNKDNKNYNKFKRYWKLLLKDSDKINCTKSRYQASFKKSMREIDIIEYLLDQSEELKESYELYQNIKTAIKLKDPILLETVLNNPGDNISKYMKISVKTTKRYKEYIINMMNSDYTNGLIEGINNKIKVIKRIAFGYRSFVHFKNRILITQGMLKLKAI